MTVLAHNMQALQQLNYRPQSMSFSPITKKIYQPCRKIEEKKQSTILRCAHLALAD